MTLDSNKTSNNIDEIKLADAEESNLPSSTTAEPSDTNNNMKFKS